MRASYYRNARGEHVMTHAFFASLDPNRLAQGHLRLR